MVGKILGVIAGVCALAVVAFLMSKKKGSTIDLSSIKTETVDGELKFSECVAWLKNKNLRKGVDVPIVVSEPLIKAKSVTFENSDKVTKDGYQMFMLAVFNNETEEITDAVIIYAKSFDQMSSEVVEKAKNAPDGIVVLD